MFEREIFNALVEGIDDLTAGNNGDQSFLKRLFLGPGWEGDEVDKLVEFWNSDEGKPVVVHNYPRLGAKLPLYSIVLGSDVNDRDYLGEAAPEYIDTVETFIAEVEKELGHTITAHVFRATLTYNLYVYAETPDVCLAYYNVLRSVIVAARARFRGLGLFETTFSGMDLAPDLRYQGENVFTRVFTLKGWAHTLFAEEHDLGPLATGRGKSIARVHVADNVIGVDPGVTVEGQDDED